LCVNHITLAGNSESNALKAPNNIILVNWSIPARVELREKNLEVTQETKDVTNKEKTRNKYKT
jgi:hypothetical protein